MINKDEQEISELTLVPLHQEMGQSYGDGVDYDGGFSLLDGKKVEEGCRSRPASNRSNFQTFTFG